jgi:FAD:protein FMN transferase
MRSQDFGQKGAQYPMMTTRRRFITISAAALGCAAIARSYTPRSTWRGVAFGADVEITLQADPAQAAEAIAKIRQNLRSLEAEFSLYDPKSALSGLNARGALDRPSQDFLTLLWLCNEVHRDSQGRFDPCVQSKWQAIAAGQGDRMVGTYGDVRVGGARVSLLPGMALTLNGIAQGFASDQIHASLKAAGFRTFLVNVGEFRSEGGRWQIGIENTSGHQIGQAQLVNGAIATSAKAGTLIRGRSHLINPFGGEAIWKTVSVQATTAALADGFSTAFSLMPEPEIRHVFALRDDIQKLWLERPNGDVLVVA